MRAEKESLEKTWKQLQRQQEQSQGLSRVFGMEMENLASFLSILLAECSGNNPDPRAGVRNRAQCEEVQRAARGASGQAHQVGRADCSR